MTKRGNGGFVLLEVVAAVTILAVTAVAAMTLVIQAGDAVARSIDAEREIRRASAFLEAVTLWTREELDQRLGIRRQGPWLLSVDREVAGLYRLRLMTSDSLVLLETAAARPVEP